MTSSENMALSGTLKMQTMYFLNKNQITKAELEQTLCRNEDWTVNRTP